MAQALPYIGGILSGAGSIGGMFQETPTGGGTTTTNITGQYKDPTLTYGVNEAVRGQAGQSISDILAGKTSGITDPTQNPLYNMIAPSVTESYNKNAAINAAQMAGMYQRGGMGLSSNQEAQERELRAASLVGQTGALGNLGTSLITPQLQNQQFAINQALANPLVSYPQFTETGRRSVTEAQTRGGK